MENQNLSWKEIRKHTDALFSEISEILPGKEFIGVKLASILADYILRYRSDESEWVHCSGEESSYLA